MLQRQKSNRSGGSAGSSPHSCNGQPPGSVYKGVGGSLVGQATFVQREHIDDGAPM